MIPTETLNKMMPASNVRFSDALLLSQSNTKTKNAKHPYVSIHAEQFYIIRTYTAVASAAVQAPDMHHLGNVLLCPTRDHHQPISIRQILDPQKNTKAILPHGPSTNSEFNAVPSINIAISHK